jgi:hypothetical protein
MKTHISIVDELFKVLVSSPQLNEFAWYGLQYINIFKTDGGMSKDAPVRNALRVLLRDITMMPGEGKYGLLLAFAFQYPLHSYVEHRFRNGQSIGTRVNNYSLLSSAVIRSDLKMVQLLFKYGANPNIPECPMEGTPWYHALLEANKYHNREGKPSETCGAIIKLFLEHNADPHILVGKRTANSIILDVFGATSPLIRDLLSTLPELERSQKSPKRYSHKLKVILRRAG